MAAISSMIIVAKKYGGGREDKREIILSSVCFREIFNRCSFLLPFPFVHRCMTYPPVVIMAPILFLATYKVECAITWTSLDGVLWGEYTFLGKYTVSIFFSRGNKRSRIMPRGTVRLAFQPFWSRFIFFSSLRYYLLPLYTLPHAALSFPSS